MALSICQPVGVHNLIWRLQDDIGNIKLCLPAKFYLPLSHFLSNLLKLIWADATEARPTSPVRLMFIFSPKPLKNRCCFLETAPFERLRKEPLNGHFQSNFDKTKNGFSGFFPKYIPLHNEPITPQRHGELVSL